MVMLTRVAWHYAWLRWGLGFRTRQALERHQQAQAARLVQDIGRRSPFYASRGLRRLADAPLMNKALMMEHFDAINTVGVTRDEALALAIDAERTRNFSRTLRGCTVGLSSGTSGHRGLFVVSPREMAMHAAAMLARVLPGNPLARHRIGFFLRSDSRLYQSSNVGATRLCFFDLQRPLADLAAELQDFRPSILVAPATVLGHLARLAREGSLRIAPRRVISVAEVLEPHDATAIAATWGTIVHQVYECTEGFLGATCAHGTLHLNEDLVLVEREYLDAERRRFVPIITDLYRTTQPHLRYRLDDVLVLRREACPCGSILTALEAIEGRCDDVLYFPATAPSAPPVAVYADFVRRAILLGSRDLEDYRVVQRSEDHLEVSLLGPEGLASDNRAGVEREFQALAATLNARPPRLSFVPLVAAPATTKRRRVQRVVEATP